MSGADEQSLRRSRFKLKFSPDKVDTMVIQAIALLDDLDKEINIYSMRVKVCLRDLGFSSWKIEHCLGMVWLALPGDGENSVGQPGIREGRETDG